jgi:hypothetical protein
MWSLYVLFDNVEFLIIWHLFTPIGAGLMEIYCVYK